MHKLFIIGALVAALAIPASAVGQGVSERQAKAQIACPQTVVMVPGRNYGICGHRFWIRDPKTGQVKAVPFWRLQHQNDQTGDRP